MKKYLLSLFTIFLLLFATSCAGVTSNKRGYSPISKNKYSPYYYYTDTNRFLFKISKHELVELITYDNLGYKGSYYGKKPMKQEDLESIKDNRNLENIPKVVEPQVGFTIASINMTIYPTDITIHRGNEKFDSNQYTRVSAFAPVFVLHTSKDKRFYYIMTEFMRGWIPSNSVKLYTKTEFAGIQQMPFVRVVKDNTTIGGVTYGIGDKIPLSKNLGPSVILLNPKGGYTEVKKDNSFIIGNAYYNEDLMKTMAESQLDNPYDWGGKEGFRDCSAYVRDLWRVFGAEIPRSSGLQKLVGKNLMDKPNSAEEFYALLDNAKPYKTLIFFKGHVMMYGGKVDGDYIIYHSVNSLVNDKGKKIKLAKVAKNKLKEEMFLDIWKRVIRVSEISPLISPELPKEPEILEITSIKDRISKYKNISAGGECLQGYQACQKPVVIHSLQSRRRICHFSDFIINSAMVSFYIITYSLLISPLAPKGADPSVVLLHFFRMI